jgi:hypothetical protein
MVVSINPYISGVSAVFMWVYKSENDIYKYISVIVEGADYPHIILFCFT